MSVFKLEKRYSHQNGVEFQHKLNGIILEGIVWHLRVWSGIKLLNFTPQCQVSHQSLEWEWWGGGIEAGKFWKILQ